MSYKVIKIGERLTSDACLQQTSLKLGNLDCRYNPTLSNPVSLIWFQTLGMAIHRWHKSAAWDDYVCFKTACIAVDLILAGNKYLTFLVTITYINWQLESWVHFVTADTFSDDGEWKKVRSTDITDMGLVATLATSAGASEVQLLSWVFYNSWLQQIFQAALKLVLGQLAGYPLLLFYRYHPLSTNTILFFF